MKNRTLLIGLIFCLLLLSFSGCAHEVNVFQGSGESTDSSSESSDSDSSDSIVVKEPENGDFLRRFGYEVIWDGIEALGIVSCQEDDFSTLVSFPMSQLYEDGTGLYLGMDTKTADVIPYVIVSRNQGLTLNGQEYLITQFLPDMQDTYGSNLTRYTEPGLVTIGEKHLWMVECQYELPDQDATVIMRRLCGMIGDSFVIFTAKKTTDDNDAVFTSLEEIVNYYRNGADAYASGEIPPEDDTAAPSEDSAPPADTTAKVDGYGNYSVRAAEPLTLQTKTVSNEIFSMEVPENWVLMTHKQFTDFGVYLYDPEVPERKIFFYCKMEYFNKTQAEADYYANLAAMAGATSFANDAMGYLVSASVPVLDPATTARFFQVYPNFIELLYEVQGYAYIYPDLNEIQVLEQYASNAPVTPTSTDNSILRISFMSDYGVACQGLVGAEVCDKLTYVFDGVDLGNYCVYNVMGITAPEAEFAELEPTLLRCLMSFDFTSSYVQQTQQSVADETEAILAAGRSMQEAYDSYNRAWSDRQKSYDIIYQKNSDATLGYDRLYDPDTGETYRAESGFYDDYDAHRDQYENSNLQLVDSSTEEYYLDPVDYYIYK